MIIFKKYYHILYWVIKINNLYRNNIKEYAITFINKPYKWASNGPDEFDCSSFTRYIYKELFNINIEKDGYGIGDTTKQMTSSIGKLKIYKENDQNKNINNINIGDILFFHRQSKKETTPTKKNRYPGHVGIYLGNNTFIHASSDAGKIIISNIDNYWIKILVASKDIISSL